MTAFVPAHAGTGCVVEIIFSAWFIILLFERFKYFTFG